MAHEAGNAPHYVVVIPVNLTPTQQREAWWRADQQLASQRTQDRFGHKGDKRRNLANEHGAKIALEQFLDGSVPGVEVRHTPLSTGDLLIRREHKDQAVHVLVRGVVSDGRYTLVGYRWGFESKRADHWDRSLQWPAYRWHGGPEQSELHDLRTLDNALATLQGEQLRLDVEA